MNQRGLNKLTNHIAGCSDLMTMAQQELGAFFGAVTELFGSEQAQVSAEDWLHELSAIDDLLLDDLPKHDLQAPTRQLRQLTVRASARLASRMNAAFLLTA